MRETCRKSSWNKEDVTQPDTQLFSYSAYELGFGRPLERETGNSMRHHGHDYPRLLTRQLRDQ